MQNVKVKVQNLETELQTDIYVAVKPDTGKCINMDSLLKKKKQSTSSDKIVFCCDTVKVITNFPFQKYKEFERAVQVEEIDGLQLVKKLAKNMEEMFHKKAQAMKVWTPHPLCLM